VTAAKHLDLATFLKLPTNHPLGSDHLRVGSLVLFFLHPSFERSLDRTCLHTLRNPRSSLRLNYGSSIGYYSLEFAPFA
jgi:hypothetical protein